MEQLQQLLKRTLVLVAHPDDEAVACGTLLQRIADPIVVFATDGSPRSDYFWKLYGSRERYARMRAIEAQNTLRAAGVDHMHFLDPLAVDQELYLQLDACYAALADLIETEIPSAILTLAYEGGHPDHDACAFLAAAAKREFGIPVWEAPLYHRDATGRLVYQSFLSEDHSIQIEPQPGELERKRTMIAAYTSQSDMLAAFDPAIEHVRPQLAYDFSLPPHAGATNYEIWGWPMRSTGLTHAFQQFQPNTRTRKKACETAA